MLVPLATMLALFMTCQSPTADRSLAEQMARSGRTAEALALFECIVAGDPADREARLWIGRLQLRIGRTEEAEAIFRAVLIDDPADVDARIGLGSTLLRTGDWRQALAILQGAEAAGGENADLFGVLARAYRRAGDDHRALGYYTRAKSLAPGDPDVVDGFEALARTYGHSVAFEGFSEGGASDARSASLAGTVRVAPRLRLEGSVRVQHRDGSYDTLAGAGAAWRLNRSSSLIARGTGWSGNTSLPTADVTAAMVHYAGALEIGASIRRLSFTDAAAIAASPLLAWDTGRWRLDTRYTYSRTSFSDSGESSGDHSVLLRETWRGWRRVGVQAAYAYGIESFETLTADRLDALGSTTVMAGLQIRTPSLTSVVAAWEHQWRSNDTTVDRFTLSFIQSFP